jgi:hypothetical protein
VPDAVNLADNPVVNNDETPGSAQNRPQKVANVISFSALSNMHTQLGNASAEAMLRFLEGENSSCRSQFHHACINQTRNQQLHYLRALWIQTSTLQSSYSIRRHVQLFNESVYIDVFYTDGHPVLSVCALVPGIQRLVLWLARAQQIYGIRFSESEYYPWQVAHSIFA